MNYLLMAALGGCTGLRCMTPIAVLCWFAYRNALHFAGWRSFTASLISVILFTVFALGEYVGDKLPTTPNRTAPGPLIARMVFGGFVAFTLAQPLLLKPWLAIVAGALGALIGAYAGWLARRDTVKALKSPDWPVAVLEDAVTLGLSITWMHIAVVHATLFVGNEGLFLR